MKTNQIWLISDTHFFHKNIIKYCSRPFKDVEEMNKTIINNWNKTVKPYDTVYMLGDFALTAADFALTAAEKIIEIGNKLEGRKTLLIGNHDRASMKTYYEAGFEFISKHPILINEFFVLSHYPQYVQSNGVYINIFGHIHDNPMYNTVSTRSFCASVERINYTPINLEEIITAIEEEQILKQEQE